MLQTFLGPFFTNLAAERQEKRPNVLRWDIHRFHKAGQLLLRHGHLQRRAVCPSGRLVHFASVYEFCIKQNPGLLEIEVKLINSLENLDESSISAWLIIIVCIFYIWHIVQDYRCRKLRSCFVIQPKEVEGMHDNDNKNPCKGLCEPLCCFGKRILFSTFSKDKFATMIESFNRFNV